MKAEVIKKAEKLMNFVDDHARKEAEKDATLSEAQLNRELDEPLRNPEELALKAEENCINGILAIIREMPRQEQDYLLEFLQWKGSHTLKETADIYFPLAKTLEDAFNRAAFGKGKERHANGKPFLEQPIVTEALLLGINGNVQQIRKKALEAISLPGTEAKVAEFLDVIVYAAATVIMLRLQEVSHA